MPKAICADRPGGIEVLDWREIETPHLGQMMHWFTKPKLV